MKDGYTYLQNSLANALMASKKNDINSWITFVYQPMPTEINVYDPFQQYLTALLPVFIIFAYIPPVYNMIFRLVKEKESGAKESMRMMGMTDTPYWFSWWAHFTLINTAVSFCSWLIMLININNYSNPIYLLLFFWLYGEAIFGQIIFLQAFFSASKYAGIVATIVYFGTALVNTFLNSNDVSKSVKILASLLPQAAIWQGAVVYANYECTGVGLNASTAKVEYNDYTFAISLGMMAASFVLFTGLGLYLDKVIPSKFGSTRHPLFCLDPKFYGCCRKERSSRINDEEAEELYESMVGDSGDVNFEMDGIRPENYEAPPIISKRLEANGDYAYVRALRREFGDFVAVKNLNFKIYDSQIFCLLGHNGAGKSTTISMLTGLIGRTSGTAKVYEKDMFEETDEVREFLGICPQHDVLFELLTPREHIDIFYDFKGGDPERKVEEIESLIQSSGLNVD